MRSRRVILSDDEDDEAGEYALAAPTSSSDLALRIDRLNVRTTAPAIPGIERASSTAPAINTGGEYWDDSGAVLSQADGAMGYLDPETTVRVMHGGANDDEEEYDFEAESLPTRKKLDPSGTTKHKSRPQAGVVTSSGRQKRDAALKAEAQLHHLYSEFDMGNKPEKSDDDTSFSDSDAPESGNVVGSSGRYGAGGETQDGDDSATDAHSRRRRSASAGSGKKPSSARRREVSLTESPAAAPRRQSVRTQSLSSRKEQQYQKARSDMQHKASGGLDAALESSSDSGGGEGYSDSTEDDTPPVGVGSSSGAARRYEEHSPASSRGHRRNEPRTKYTFSVSKIKSPKSAARGVGFAHWRDEREADRDVADETEESDINDFIVNSDEERAEEEERAAEAALRKEQRRQQRKAEQRRGGAGTGAKARDIIAAATAQHSRDVNRGQRGSGRNNEARSDSDEADIAPVRRNGSTQQSSSDGKRAASSSVQSVPAASVTGGSSARKRRRVLDSSSDEEEGERYASDTHSGRAAKRRNTGTAEVVDLTDSRAGAGEDTEEMQEGSGGSAGEGSAGSSGEEEEGSEGEGSEEDSGLDGPMLYHKVRLHAALKHSVS
jgi:hypothetical protein